MRKSFLPLAALLLGMLGAALPARAATYSVTNTSDSGPGSLRQALADADTAPGDDIITFSTSKFNSPQTITLGSVLFVSSNLSLVGPQGGVTIKQTNPNASAVLYVGTVDRQRITASISNLTLTGGTGVSTDIGFRSGGGIYNSQSDLTVSNCTITGNSASNGGGIANSGGTLTISNSVISANNGGNGGGILNDGVAGNSVLVVNNSVISGNTNDGVSNGGTATFTNCTVSGNMGGSGISNGNILTLTNCTISGNDNENGFGGGGLLNNKTAVVKNCTISGNTAPDQGGPQPPVGGIYNNFSASLTIDNTILSNPGGNLSNRDSSVTISDQGYNLVSDNASGLLTASTDKLSTDPLLDTRGLRNNGGAVPTLALLAGSPAIDAGNSTLTTDERSFARPFDSPSVVNAQNGNGSDIGAFEVVPDTAQTGSSRVVNTTDDHSDGSCSIQDCSLREAIRFAPAKGTVTFDPFTFAQLQTIFLNGTPLPTISNNLTISGPSVGVAIDGKGASTILYITRGNVQIARLSLSNASIAIRNVGMLTFSDGEVSGNGTGIANASRGVATLSNNLLRGNGIGISNMGTLTVDDLSATGNTDALINTTGAKATLRTSTLVGNGNGAQNTGTLSLQNSTVAGNGDGVRSQKGTVTVTQCTFVSNTNALVCSGTLSVMTSTITGNGGGIKSSAASVTVKSTLSVSNGQNFVGTLSKASVYNLLNTTAQVAGLETAPNGFPLLKDNGGPTATVALLTGSPAINKGASASSTATDQRGPGFSRVVGGRSDIGAFEFGNPATPADAASPASPSDTSPSAGSS